MPNLIAFCQYQQIPFSGKKSVSDLDLKTSRMVEVGEEKMEKTRVATEDCPICLDPIKWGLMTSCGHNFCGDCILEVWRTRTAAIPCPMCRQKVTDMEPYLSEEERNTKEPRRVELKSRILEEVARYQKSIQDVPELGEEDGEDFDDIDFDDIDFDHLDFGDFDFEGLGLVYLYQQSAQLNSRVRSVGV